MRPPPKGLPRCTLLAAGGRWGFMAGCRPHPAAKGKPDRASRPRATVTLVATRRAAGHHRALRLQQRSVGRSRARGGARPRMGCCSTRATSSYDAERAADPACASRSEGAGGGRDLRGRRCRARAERSDGRPARAHAPETGLQPPSAAGPAAPQTPCAVREIGGVRVGRVPRDRRRGQACEVESRGCLSCTKPEPAAFAHAVRPGRPITVARVPRTRRSSWRSSR